MSSSRKAAQAGPEDTSEGLLIADDFEQRRQPPSRISSAFGITTLEPVFAEVERQSKPGKEVAVQPAKHRDLFEGHQASLRGDPIEVSLGR